MVGKVGAFVKAASWVELGQGDEPKDSVRIEKVAKAGLALL